MDLELVTMSTREIDVLDVIRKIHEQRLTQVKAGELLGLSDRQVRRVCVRYERDGAAGLVSRQRGRPSNHRLPDELRDRAVSIVRERYSDFGPPPEWRVGSGPRRDGGRRTRPDSLAPTGRTLRR